MYEIKLTIPLNNHEAPITTTLKIKHDAVDVPQALAKSLATQYNIRAEVLQKGDMIKDYDFRPERFKTVVNMIDKPKKYDPK